MIENTKHTPGPWFVNEEEPMFVVDSENYAIAEALRGDCVTDARLIAAAPELFAVAQMVVDYENGLKGGLSDCVRAARAAIDKASA